MSNEKQSYWERRHTNRTLKNVYAMEKNSKKMIKAINQVYENTAKSINKEIDNIYRNYVKSNDVGEDLAKEYLTNAEKHRYIKMLEKEIKSTTNPTYKKELIAKYNAGSAIYRMSRLENLKQSIQVKIQKTSAIEEELQRIHYKKVIKDGIKKPSIFKLKKKKSDAFNTVNKHVVNETLKTKWEYGDFSENIWKNNKKLIEVMDNVLKPGFLRGKSTAVLARKVNQIMGAGQFNATRLVRTESTRYFNLASLESFKEMGVKEYQILAVLDSRTSKICHKQDKRTYKIEEAKAGITLPPFHPFCRSTIIPVIDDNNAEENEEKIEDDKEIVEIPKIDNNSEYKVVGKIKSEWNLPFNVTNDEIILRNERIEHIKESHSEVEKEIKNIPKILENPNYIYIDNKNENTIWISKIHDEEKYLKMTVKLITDKRSKFKNSIIQMQYIKEKKISKSIKNKRIRMIFYNTKNK